MDRISSVLASGGCRVLSWAIPQLQLPVFPAGCTEINSELAFECRDHQVTYFNGHLPVFTHAAEDLASFRFFTTAEALLYGIIQLQEKIRRTSSFAR